MTGNVCPGGASDGRDGASCSVGADVGYEPGGEQRVVHRRCVVGRRPEHGCVREPGGERGGVAELVVTVPSDEENIGADVIEAGVVFHEWHFPQRCERGGIAAEAGDAFPHRLPGTAQHRRIRFGKDGSYLFSPPRVQANNVIPDAAENRPANARIGLQDAQPDHRPDRVSGEIHLAQLQVIDQGGDVAGAGVATVGAGIMRPVRAAAAAPVGGDDRATRCGDVLTGEIGVLVGEETASAGPGAWALKPRGVLHAMWNSEATPARIIEVLTPGGSERWFEETAALQPGDTEGFRACCQRHGIEFFPDSPWLQKLQERYGL